MPIYAETLTADERRRVREAQVSNLARESWDTSFGIEYVDPDSGTWMEVVGERFGYSDEAADRARELFPRAVVGVTYRRRQ